MKSKKISKWETGLPKPLQRKREREGLPLLFQLFPLPVLPGVHPLAITGVDGLRAGGPAIQTLGNFLLKNRSHKCLGTSKVYIGIHRPLNKLFNDTFQFL